MSPLRLCLAIGILRLELLLLAAFNRILAAEEASQAREPTGLRPAERMLLGSIAGLGICVLWIWISARAAS